MIASLAFLYNIDVCTLQRHIVYAAFKARQDKYGFNDDVFEKELLEIFSSLQPCNTIDEIYVYHLTRRLSCKAEDFSSDNLKSLLLGKSLISDFLKKHEVSFVISDDHPVLVYKGQEVNLCDTNKNDVCYLRSRLGYSIRRKDYCFNGFAFRDLLMKNQYTLNLYYCPEFINVLSRFLKNKQIIKDYFENSRYYCLTYKLKLTDILFDEKDSLNNDEKVNYFLVKICYRIWEYMQDPRYLFDNENPIIRIPDNACISASNLISKEIITYEMIEQ